MLSWLTANGGTIGVIVLLLLVTGCGCSNCPMSGSCHTKK